MRALEDNGGLPLIHDLGVIQVLEDPGKRQKATLCGLQKTGLQAFHTAIGLGGEGGCEDLLCGYRFLWCGTAKAAC